MASKEGVSAEVATATERLSVALLITVEVGKRDGITTRGRSEDDGGDLPVSAEAGIAKGSDLPATILFEGSNLPVPVKAGFAGDVDSPVPTEAGIAGDSDLPAAILVEGGNLPPEVFVEGFLALVAEGGNLPAELSSKTGDEVSEKAFSVLTEAFFNMAGLESLWRPSIIAM